jgi:hypothetical protein
LEALKLVDRAARRGRDLVQQILAFAQAAEERAIAGA